MITTNLVNIIESGNLKLNWIDGHDSGWLSTGFETKSHVKLDSLLELLEDLKLTYKGPK